MVEISKCSKILYDLRDVALDHSFLEYCETGGIRLFLYREISTIFFEFSGPPISSAGAIHKFHRGHSQVERQLH